MSKKRRTRKAAKVKRRTVDVTRLQDDIEEYDPCPPPPQPPPAAIYLFNERGEKVAWITRIERREDALATVECQLIGRIEVMDGWPVLRGDPVQARARGLVHISDGLIRAGSVTVGSLRRKRKKSQKRATK